MRLQRLCGLLVMARAAAAALTFTSNISNFYMCTATQQALLQWSGGIIPYTVQVVLGDETTYVVTTLTSGTTATSGTWTVNLAATQYLSIKVTDGLGSTALSNPFYLYPCEASSSVAPTSIASTPVTTSPTTSPTIITTTSVNNTSTAVQTTTPGDTTSSATSSPDNQDTSAGDGPTATPLEPVTSTVVVPPDTTTTGVPAAKDDGGTNVPAIAGGAAGGGAAVLIALAVIMWMWRRRNRRKRDFDIDEFTTGIDGIGRGGGGGGGGKGGDYMDAAMFRPTPYPSQSAAAHSASGLVPGLPQNTSMFTPPVHASQAYAGGSEDFYTYPAGASAGVATSDMLSPLSWSDQGQSLQPQQQPAVWANRDSMATTMTAATHVSGPGVSWQPAPGQVMAPTWPSVPNGANGHSMTGSMSGLISGPNGSVVDVTGGSGVIAAPAPTNAKEQEAFAATRAAQEAAAGAVAGSSASPMATVATGSTQDLFAMDAEDAALAAGGQLPPSYRPEWEERRRAEESPVGTTPPVVAPTPVPVDTPASDVVPAPTPAPAVAAPVAPTSQE